MQRSCVITEVASHTVNSLSTFLLDSVTFYATEEEESTVTYQGSFTQNKHKAKQWCMNEDVLWGLTNGCEHKHMTIGDLEA